MDSYYSRVPQRRKRKDVKEKRFDNLWVYPHSPTTYQPVLCGTESRSPPVHPADEAAGRNPAESRAMGWECCRGRDEGSREGAHPRVQSAAAACTLRGRNRVSDFYLADLPPGSPKGATGKSVGGHAGGMPIPPTVTVRPVNSDPLLQKSPEKSFHGCISEASVIE